MFLFNEGPAAGTDFIAEGSGLSLGTTHRQLHDMKALRSISCRKAEDGSKALEWTLQNPLINIIKTAELGEIA
jgi:hypothetical protein